MKSLSFGLVGQRAVFMDERTDSYFTIDPVSENQLRRRLAAGEPMVCDAASLTLGAAADRLELCHAQHPSALHSLLHQRLEGRARLAEIMKVGRLVRRTRSWMRKEPIDLVLQRITACASGGQRETRRDEIIREAAHFLNARRMVPIGRNCLLDSLSLLSWLGDHRSAVALIFGVKLDPFAAHCWVQLDHLLLNERVETAAAFTPVRVIRCSDAML